MKAKDEYERKKNNIIKELMEKDDTIHKLSLELNEMKNQARRIEAKKFEKKLKEANRASVDKSLMN